MPPKIGWTYVRGEDRREVAELRDDKVIFWWNLRDGRQTLRLNEWAVWSKNARVLAPKE